MPATSTVRPRFAADAHRRTPLLTGYALGTAVVGTTFVLSRSGAGERAAAVLLAVLVLLWFGCLLGAVVAPRAFVRWVLAGVAVSTTVIGAAALFALVARTALLHGD